LNYFFQPGQRDAQPAAFEVIAKAFSYIGASSAPGMKGFMFDCGLWAEDLPHDIKTQNRRNAANRNAKKRAQ
jgi:hypothetical protein